MYRLTCFIGTIVNNLCEEGAAYLSEALKANTSLTKLELRGAENSAVNGVYIE